MELSWTAKKTPCILNVRTRPGCRKNCKFSIWECQKRISFFTALHVQIIAIKIVDLNRRGYENLATFRLHFDICSAPKAALCSPTIIWTVNTPSYSRCCHAVCNQWSYLIQDLWSCLSLQNRRQSSPFSAKLWSCPFLGEGPTLFPMANWRALWYSIFQEGSSKRGWRACAFPLQLRTQPNLLTKPGWDSFRWVCWQVLHNCRRRMGVTFLNYLHYDWRRTRSKAT